MLRKTFTCGMLVVLAVAFVLGATIMPTASVAGEKVKVFIGFELPPTAAEEALVRSLGGVVKYKYNSITAIAAEVPEAAIAGLKRNPKVVYIEEDGKAFPNQEVLPWGVDRIDAELVHPYNTGADVKVFILDTGIDYTHPDLINNCHSGVGYKDGTMIDPLDDHGHGTHVAGIVAAEDNEIGVIGVAPGASLYGIKVLNQFEDGYYGLYSDIIKGIEWSVNNGAQVINMSLGGTFDSTTLQAACDAAYESGVLLVSSAGNSGNPPGKGDNIGYPARYGSVIAVAATYQSDKRARWSSTGLDLELSAPGVAINSTLLGGGYGEKSGTSMASPHVAGTAALVIASGITDAAQVRLILQETADDLGDNGWDTKYGYGLVDADAALNYAPVPNDPPVADANGPYTGTEDIAITFDGSASYDPDGSITSYDWDFGDGTTGSGVTTTYVYSVAGTYTVTLTVTDNGGLTGTDTSIVTVTEQSTLVMHVASIDMSLKTAGPNVNAIATVTVVDVDDGAPVGSALVSGHWSGLTSDIDSGVTDENGTISLKSDRLKNANGTFTFNIDNVEKDAWTFDSSGVPSESITVGGTEGKLAGTSLGNAHPNPANPETIISFSINQSGYVSLIIYNMLGQQVCTLVDELKSPGIYTIRWNGTDDRGNNVSSGIYLYQLRSENFVETKTMSVIR